MRSTTILITLVCLLFFSEAMTQVAFDRSQSALLKEASNQWLCSELKAVNPAYFDCEKQAWKLPLPGFFDLFGDSILVSPEQTARYERIWFPQGDCRQFLAIVAMADVYMPLFKRKAEQLNLHPHTAFLPIVLSGCNQQFRGDDAAGLWAMNYLAARKEHLKIDTLVDERMGGDFSTDAALKHFKYMLGLHSNNYWRVTNAYRFGPSQIADSEQLQKGLELPSETNNGASDFLRFTAYTIHLFQSVHVENQLNNCFDILGHYQAVQIEKPLLVEAIARVLSVDESNLRNANPVYTGKYIVPGYRKVPFVMEDTLIGRYRIMLDSIARWQPTTTKTESIEWKTEWIKHRVAQGESLGRIAAKYDVSISQLKKWNQLRSDKIRKGQILKIEKRRKVSQPKPAVKKEKINTDQPTDTLHTIATPPTPTSLNKPKPSSEKRTKSKYYTVKQGDSLWSIAKKYPGVTEKDLMKWNKCGANIRPGQKLIIKK
jgi:membrane-bound lytic murein transglycosylase D